MPQVQPLKAKKKKKEKQNKTNPKLNNPFKPTVAKKKKGKYRELSMLSNDNSM